MKTISRVVYSGNGIIFKSADNNIKYLYSYPSCNYLFYTFETPRGVVIIRSDGYISQANPYIVQLVKSDNFKMFKKDKQVKLKLPKYWE